MEITYRVNTIPELALDYDFFTRIKASVDGSWKNVKNGSPTVTIDPGVVDFYDITSSSGNDIANQKVGVNFDVKVTAYDEFGNITSGDDSLTVEENGSGSLHGETVANTSGDGTDTLSLSYDAVALTGNEIHLTVDGDDSNDFEVAGLTIADTLTAPGSSTNDSTPLINWSNVDGTDVTYQMQLVKKGGTCDFASPLLTKSTGGTSEYQLTAEEALNDQETYCVKVIATDDYSNSVTGNYEFNLLTSKPATPTKAYIATVGDASNSGHPVNTINIYNNENVTVKVEWDGNLDGGKAFVKIKDGLDRYTSEYSANISGSGTRSVDVSGINADSLQQGTGLDIYARVEDAGTNSSDWKNTTNSAGDDAWVTKDTSSPARPSVVSFVDDPINIANQATVNISVTGESGAEAYYTVTGGGTISDHFTMSGATTVSPDKNMTSLADGTLTASVYLVDSAWNHSSTRTGTVTKDAAAPDVALTYDLSRPVKDADTLRVTATFNEAVKDSPTPQIAIDFAGAGSDLSATDMTKTDATHYYYDVNVPAGNDGTATVTISNAQDLSGNANNAATNNTFTVDNTKPTVSGSVAEDPADAGTINISLTFNENMDQAVAPTVIVTTAGDAQTLTASGSFSDATHWSGTATVESGNANGTATLKVSGAKDVAGNTMDANNNVDTFTIDTVGPVFTVVNDTETGPVKTDTINITVADATGTVASRFYGFSSDATCNASDTIATAFDSGVNFDIAGNHTDYLCVKATDNAGNISYETVGQLNTDNTLPVFSSVSPATDAKINNVTNASDIGYTLSENIASGTVTIARTGGSADGAHTCTLVGTALNSGGHTLDISDTTNGCTVAQTLVDGAIYTFTFDGTDAAGNAAAQVSRTGVLFDTTAPTITNVSSDKVAGTYTIGEVIDIDVTFSEAVTTTGSVTVTLETGATDRTCTFSVANATTGTCNYIVQAGDTNSDLEVNDISGTIADQAGNAMTNFAPATNLAANEALVVDTTAPTIQSITSVTGDGFYNATDGINVQVTFSENVTLAGGTLDVTLDTGDTVQIAAFGPGLTADGTYTVGAGDTSADLDSTGIILNGGTLRDAAGNDTTVALPATTIADGSAIVIDTTNPTTAVTIANTNYNTAGWSDANTINGTASDTNTITSVEVAVMREDGATDHWWDGTDWDATSETWVSVTAGTNTWTYTLAVGNLTNGKTYTVKARATDNAGNITTAGFGEDSFVYDTTAPSVNITAPTGTDTVNADKIIAFTDNELTASQCSINAEAYSACTSGVTKVSDLAGWAGVVEGATFTLNLRDTDLAGNTGTDSEASLVKDTTTPSVATVTLSDPTPTKAGTVTFTIDFAENMNQTINPTVTFGTADPYNQHAVSASPTWSDSNTFTAQITIPDTGAWDGTNTIKISGAKDLAGNTMADNTANTFLIDTTDPVATLNALTPDPNNDNTPSFTGNVTDSATVLTAIQYRVDGGGWTGVTITDGALDEINEDFSFTIAGVADGSHTVDVIGTDSAGNDSALASDTFSIDVVTPTVTGANITVTGNTGTGGKFKRGNTVSVSWNNTGAGDNNSDVASVSVSFAEFGGGSVAAINSAGTWSASYVLPNDLNYTGVKVSVTAIDTASNPTTTGDNATFDVDTQNPAAPTITMSDPVNDTNKAAITLAGGGEANGTLNYSIASTGGGGPITGTIAIDGAGSYSDATIDVSALGDGTLTATATVTDTAGNTGASATDSSTKDVLLPTITSVNSDHANGSFKAGEVIDIDVTFSENVTSTGNATVSLSSGGSCTFAITNASSGTCNYTVSGGENSADLNATISGTIADQNGNAMTNFTPGTTLATNKAIVIDTAAPASPTVTAPAGVTTVNAANYTIQGAAEANALVKIYRGITEVGSQQLSGGGTSYSISASLNQDVANDFTVTATDLAGNKSAGQAIPTITEDSINPTVNAGTDKVKNALFTQDATVTDSSALTYLWSKQSGLGTVTFGSSTSEDTTVSANTDGTYVIRLTATDAAGNSAYDEFSLTWDTTLPTSAASSPTYDTAGTINVTFSTGADFSGIAEVQLWKKFDGGGWVNTGQTSTATSGTFVFTPTDGDGIYYFGTKAVDNATNAEADPSGSGDDNTIYDTVNPTDPSNFAVTSGAPYNTWSATNNTAISWTASTDATSGLDGFNYLWDTSATTSLQGSMTPTDGSTWISNEATVTNSKTFSSDGQWYFHIRPRDNAGNWGATTTYGPFKIDTADPNISHSTVSSETAGVDIHISADVTDSGSGVKEVRVYYKYHGDSSFTDNAMSCDGSWHCTYDIPDEENSNYDVKYYIRALDNVDNDTFDGTSGSPHTVDIVPASLDHFTFVFPTSGTRYAGTWFTVVLEARDQFNNVATQFNGSGDAVNFTTDEAVNVFVEDTGNATSSAFDNGVWGGRIKFGTGAITPSGNNIVLTATDTDSADNGSVTMTTSGTNFGTAGTIAGANDGAETGTGGESITSGEAPAVQGAEDGALVPNDGQQTETGAAPWWKRFLPWMEIALGLAFVGWAIPWWIRRRGGGAGGSNLTGFLFSTLKIAGQKIRMFLW